MSAPIHAFRRLLLLCAAGVVSALAADSVPSPRPWEPDAFLPVTEARIAALPAADQPAWRAYWTASTERSRRLPERDLVDHSPSKPLPGQPIGASYSKGVRLGAPAKWYATEEARTVADHVVQWQTATGGWTKSGDYTRARAAADDHHDVWSPGTFDNNATLYEMRFLALVAQAGGDDPRTTAWRASFLRGLDYVIAAQYPNGGFPQIYPLVGGYHDAITFNDDAMVHILELCRDIAAQKAEFEFAHATSAERARDALARGIECLLATQLRDADGRRTVWGQQHDALTLQPCAARNFEPISECSLESAGLVRFLMTVPSPSPKIIAAVEGAMAWFPANALHGVVWDRDATTGTGLVATAGAPDLWARFYELGTSRPIFSERDRIVHYTVTELSLERRKGYGWYHDRATALFATYAAWKAGLAAGPMIWSLDRPDRIGGHATKIYGQPTATPAEGLMFNGKSDGVLLDTNPIEGLAEFTIEILFRPDADGPAEQRFFHIEDQKKSRLLLETRILPGGRWALDAFLYTTENSRVLLDRTKTHPCDQWTWVALRYKDGRMSHAINGVTELEGDVAFPPMIAGATSIGVRQNLVHWFKGSILEIRFHRAALTLEALQRD